MRIKFKLPDLVIEKVGQYLGNCRVYNGEIIQTIDKTSKEIVELQWIQYYNYIFFMLD